MNALIDTCVVIDFLQKREPFAEEARQIFVAAATDRFSGFITAKAATDIYYLAHRFTHSDQDSRELLIRVLSVLRMLDTSAEDVYRAIDSDISDFEDAVMVSTGERTGMACVVTRNTRDYRNSGIPIFTPEQFLAEI